MSSALRDALLFGCLLAIVYLCVQGFTTRWDLVEVFVNVPQAILLILAPAPVPAAVNMIHKATSKAKLPIFNTVDERAALVIGGVLLIIALGLGVVLSFRHPMRVGKRDHPWASRYR